MKRVAWILAAAALFATACGSGTTTDGQDNLVTTDGFDPGPQPGDDGGQDLGRRDSGPFDGCVLASVQDPEVAIEVKKKLSTPIDVLIFQAGGGPGVGVDVGFRIARCLDDVTGEEVADPDASLDLEQVTSGENGRVRVQFLAGESSDMTCEVEITAECAQAATVAVHVYEYLPGCVTATFTYEGSLDQSTLKDITVYVMDPGVGTTQLTCGHLFPEKPVPDDNVIADRTATNLFGSVQFEDLPADARYLVYAVAKGPGGCPVANACTVVTNLPPGACEPVTLEFKVSNLVVAGCYDTVDHFDFTALIQQCAGGGTTIPSCIQGGTGDVGKTVCCAVAEIIKFFTTPGTTILETLEFFASQYFGSLIVGTLFDIFEDAATQIINDYLFKNSPDWVKNIFDVGKDITSVVTNLEMLSTMCLGKVPGSSSVLEVEGMQEFTGIALYWDGVRYPFDLAQLNQTQFPMDLIAGHFIALIYKFNQMTINQHEIGLNYGRLVLFAINELIIKNVTGGQANTVEEAAKLWFDCEKISQGILGEIAGSIPGLDKDDVKQACDSVLNTFLPVVTNMVASLSLPTTLQLTGSCRLVDEGCNLVVDKLVDGKWSGMVTGSGTTPAAFTGTFSATRK